MFTKGAPDVLLTRCTHEVVGVGKTELTQERRAEIVRTPTKRSPKEALRTLALAAHYLPNNVLDEKEPEQTEYELVWVGLIGMMDPPRPEAAAAVAQAHAAGIRTLMITGDHPRTAAVIAQELGIASDGRVVTGAALSRLSDDALTRPLRSIGLRAREPRGQAQDRERAARPGAIVAMTGDGVNDAPALKTADIGVAMGIAGTDVSREAADIVLTDDNFASIVAAVEEGRAIFANIRKFLRYLLSSNIGEVLTMFVGVLLAEPSGSRGRPASWCCHCSRRRCYG